MYTSIYGRRGGGQEAPEGGGRAAPEGGGPAAVPGAEPSEETPGGEPGPGRGRRGGEARRGRPAAGRGRRGGEGRRRDEQWGEDGKK